MISEHRFDRRFGKGAFARLRLMLRDETRTYAQIGSLFGITKQRISQLAQFLRINGSRRQRKRNSRRPPCLTNTRAEYPPKVRLVLGELERRGIPVATYYNVYQHSHIAQKQLTTVLVKGVPCKIGYRNVDKVDRFTKFWVSPPVRKAKAVVWGIQRGSTFRLYVIPLSELKNVTYVYIPVTGRYIGTSRKPIRDWTRFENAWHLLREGSPTHSNRTPKIR